MATLPSAAIYENTNTNLVLCSTTHYSIMKFLFITFLMLPAPTLALGSYLGFEFLALLGGKD